MHPNATINEAQEKIIKRIESIDAKTKLVDVFKEGKKNQT